ncbi:MAG: hypothetical protein IH946_05255, partial [Bacteroidetes bacterium]|nr:hypothetical protein [Bacteroidota bacterium]
MKRVLNSKNALLLIAVLLIAAGQYFQSGNYLNKVAVAELEDIQNRLRNSEIRFYKLIEDSSFIDALKHNRTIAREIYKLPFVILIYQEDSLIFWNKNLIEPYYPIDNYPDGSSFVRLKNGEYHLIKRYLPAMGFGSSSPVALALIPIKMDYGIN